MRLHVKKKFFTIYGAFFKEGAVLVIDGGAGGT